VYCKIYTGDRSGATVKLTINLASEVQKERNAAPSTSKVAVPGPTGGAMGALDCGTADCPDTSFGKKQNRRA
jgi:hypothetical protein